MPVGRGKKLLRCSIMDALHATMAQEAQRKGLDLGVVVEGYLQQALGQAHGAEQVVAHRLDTLLRGQARLLQVLEVVVGLLENQQGHPGAPDEPAPPIATYTQMYAAEHPRAPRGEDTSADVAPQEPPKRRWW
jgi:hypothetical protein